jgi:hypothetical protein
VTVERSALGEVCRGCRSASVDAVVDLGDVPASDSFPLVSEDPSGDRTYPLELRICRDCKLIQLGPGESPPPEQPGPVESQTMLRHAAESTDLVVSREGLTAGDTLIDLHSAHGGSWGPDLRRHGLRAVSADGKADLVVDVHFLMHEEDLDGVLGAHASRLAPGGVLVCEFFHALPMVAGNLIDTVRHGHFTYLTLLSAVENLGRHELTVTWVREISLYGGSLQLAARRASSTPVVDPSVDDLLRRERAEGLDGREALLRFGDVGRSSARRLRSEIETRRAAGRRVAAYGAPSKAPVLLALAGVDQELLSYTVDLSPAKSGRRIPGAGIPIRAVEELFADHPDDVVVLTWDIADEVAEQLATSAADTGWDPTLIAPLPDLRERRLSERRWRLLDR